MFSAPFFSLPPPHPQYLPFPHRPQFPQRREELSESILLYKYFVESERKRLTRDQEKFQVKLQAKGKPIAKMQVGAKKENKANQRDVDVGGLLCH